MQTKNISLTMEQAIGSNNAILVEVKENFDYKDGKPSDVRTGIKYVICCPSNRFEKITVKTTEKGLLPISQEELDERNIVNDFQYVSFQNFSGRLWQDFNSKQLKISATADKIIFMEEK